MAENIDAEFARIAAVEDIGEKLEVVGAMLARFRVDLIKTHGFSVETAEALCLAFARSMWAPRRD